ncbi:imelysin family protein [Myxococcus sp. RHSTA-1-4]|uniref:imelysin family protein n=1 Tax=Myxococcus sp. RHSTA-1-4 TaxID=2874601 RepID=UPI001CC0ACF3|nr:imelysin family protein [Myxococcus sp. RHSTA-1-4]MBZ4419038.1 imelysin family protein [Myxococcus sp. RHSTA-1-4]
MNTESPRPATMRRGSALALVVPALLCLTACKGEGSKPDAGTGGPDTSASRQALLVATSACVQQTAREFLTSATALETAVAAWAAQPDATTRDAARAAFHDAMDRWQVAEVMQLGPAAPRSLPGGAEIRDNIYSWPLVSRCAIEEQIVSKGYESSSFPTTLVSRRGLYALEYLLFHEGSDTACQSTSPIVSQGTWAALSQEEREARKRAYAAVVATDVRSRAAQLMDAWDPDKGGFSRTLETAGSGNAVYPTSQVALNSVSDALFYLEREVKDMKLARPLGLRDCSTATCPEYLESPFARRAKANVRANLVGFRRIAQGCGAGFDGVGFDDLLEASGAKTIAAKLREKMVAAEAGIEAVPGADLEAPLAQNKESVRALYEAVKGVTDVLKTELVTVLDLELPQSVEGDND